MPETACPGAHSSIMIPSMPIVSSSDESALPASRRAKRSAQLGSSAVTDDGAAWSRATISSTDCASKAASS